MVNNTTQHTTKKANRILVAIALLAVALNLRTSVAAIGPVLSDVISDDKLPSWFGSAITSIPILLFGVFAFAASVLAKKYRQNTVLIICLTVLTLSLILRFFPPNLAFLAGTFMAAATIAVINILMPSLIKANFPNTTLLMSNLYSSVLFLSGAAASGLTVPMEALVGGSWRNALGIWAVPCFVALALIIFIRIQGKLFNPETVASVPGNYLTFKQLFRNRTAISLMLFMGLQSAGYYSIIAWLPTLLQDAGIDRAHSGLFMIVLAVASIVGSLLASPILSAKVPQPAPAIIAGIVIALGYFGILLIPTLCTTLWLIMLGLGQGLVLALAIFYINSKCNKQSNIAQVSLFAQGFGYIIASISPALVGILNTTTASWALPILALIICLIGQTIFGIVTAKGKNIA